MPKSSKQDQLKKENKISIYDIAEAAGVSAGTVSRVMNNRDRVKSSTRGKVIQAAKELGYSPQVAIRKPEVAIITEQGFNDQINGYAATLVQYLSFELTRCGCDILLPEEAVDSLQNVYFNGMIVINHGPNVQGLVDKLEKRIPTVHIDLFPDNKTSYSVCSDHEQAGYLAADYFAKSGRKSPGLLAMDCPPNTARYTGFLRGLKENNIPHDPNLIYLSDGAEARYIGLNHLVQAGSDSIYVPGSSLEAMEALHILSYVMKKDVPDEIALIGGENDRISSFLTPPLTTIEEPLKKLAVRAVSLLGELLDGKKPGKKREILPVRLIRRVSGGPSPAV